MDKFAELAETHSAVVFCIGDYAYKLKKPVNLGFLDFSSAEARARACHRETELNRRFAPDVYLGVADVLDPAGHACDYLVAMRRMPSSRRLAALISAGEPAESAVRQVARILATQHASAVRSPDVAEHGTRDATRGRWNTNLSELRQVCGDVLGHDEIGEAQNLAERFLAGDIAAGQARQTAAIALRHLRAGAVTLVLAGGLPGTGKTTLAGGIADQLGFSLLSSDRIRKELAGLGAEQPASSPYHSGIYSKPWTDRTYSAMLRRASELLAAGESVVLDASWTSSAQREAAAAVTQQTSSDLVQLQCSAPSSVTAERMSSRSGSASDADMAVAAQMARAWDPWPDARVIATDVRSEAETTQLAVATVRPHGPEHVWRPARPYMTPD